jgi:hypothetical protein
MKLAEEYQSLEQAKTDLEKNNKSLSEIIDKNKEEIRYYSNLILQVKTKVIERVDTVKFVVRDSNLQVPIGKDIVEFEGENSVVKVFGNTYLYPYKGYKLNIEGKPFSLDVVVTKDKNDIYTGYADTHNSDLEIKDLNVRFIKEPKKFWDDFAIISGLNFTTKNVFMNLGFMKGKFGIQGIGGFDYQNHTIDKNNLFYGGGIIYKIF